tara:strand:- start:172 stop:516 length:345 start_codon:yes stop_codon:yes gene_type:complete
VLLVGEGDIQVDAFRVRIGRQGCELPRFAVILSERAVRVLVWIGGARTAKDHDGGANVVRLKLNLRLHHLHLQAHAPHIVPYQKISVVEGEFICRRESLRRLEAEDRVLAALLG